MSRVAFLMAGLLGFSCLSPLPAQSQERPNILLICVDDLKPVLGAYGDPLAKTPNIDRLAQKSVVFEQAYCNQAVCAVSRNALLVGLRPHTLGIYDLPTNFRKSAPDAITLPQWFRQNGWRTESLGKIFHVGHGNTDDEASWSVPSWRPKKPTYALAANQPTSTQKLPSGKSPRGSAYEAAEVADDFYADGATAAEAIKRLQQAAQQSDQPFFLAVGFIRPHLPFVAPQKYWDLYNRDDFSLSNITTRPENAPAYASHSSGELRQYREAGAAGSELSEELQRTLIHGYYAAASYTDAQIGKVLAELEQLKLDQNTIIVLWGDHGWHLGDHGLWCKHTNYEQAARIPVLVSHPQITPAKTKALIESVDIYPTLCELAGLPAPDKLDGSSFVKTLRSSALPHRPYALHVYPRTHPETGPVLGRAIRTDRYRLVEWKGFGAAPETAELELYDYQTDPQETRNLIEELPAVVAELKNHLATQPEAKPQVRTTSAASATRPKQDRVQMFKNRDKNQDGVLSREEFLHNQPDPEAAPARFLRFDLNKNGVLDQDEFVTAGKKSSPPTATP